MNELVAIARQPSAERPPGLKLLPAPPVDPFSGQASRWSIATAG
jgi:hypothetical protein